MVYFFGTFLDKMPEIPIYTGVPRHQMVRNARNTTPRVTHLPGKWEFWSKMIDQATNFWPQSIWDVQKYRTYFTLSLRPTYMVILTELKMV